MGRMILVAQYFFFFELVEAETDFRYLILSGFSNVVVGLDANQVSDRYVFARQGTALICQLTKKKTPLWRLLRSSGNENVTGKHPRSTTFSLQTFFQDKCEWGD
jgi:hypothetical protein